MLSDVISQYEVFKKNRKRKYLARPALSAFVPSQSCAIEGIETANCGISETTESSSL